MTLLSIAFWGIVTALVMASEGDFSGLAKTGEILIYLVAFGLVAVFLSKTGWGGAILLMLIGLAAPMIQALFKD